MILYDNRCVRDIIFRRAGSVIFRPAILVPALISTILCAVLLHIPGAKNQFVISAAISRIYATIIGFVIVVRTKMAFGRFFEGVTDVQYMFSKWRDAFVSLAVFIEASILEYQKRGDAKIVEEMLISKARLLHWFSLLSALAVQRLQIGLADTDENESDVQHLNIKAKPENRMIGPMRGHQWAVGLPPKRRMSGSIRRISQGPLTCSESLHTLEAKRPSSHSDEIVRNIKVIEQNAVLVLGAVSPDEERQILRATDTIVTVVKWILLEVSAHAVSKRLLIGPPILSRVYQELSNGMLAFFMAMKIATVPFPFPFAQFMQYALFAFYFFCPLVILESLDDPTAGLERTWLSLPMNFLCCAGFSALNEISIELEDPFGEDDNDYPVHIQQWSIVWAIEDCYFQVVPDDFSPTNFNLDQGFYRKTAKKMCKKAAKAAANEAKKEQKEAVAKERAEKAVGAAKLAPATAGVAAEKALFESDCSRLLPNIAGLRDALSGAVEVATRRSDDWQADMSGLDARLQEVLETLQGGEKERYPTERALAACGGDSLISGSFLSEVTSGHGQPSPGDDAGGPPLSQVERSQEGAQDGAFKVESARAGNLSKLSWALEGLSSESTDDAELRG